MQVASLVLTIFLVYKGNDELPADMVWSFAILMML